MITNHKHLFRGLNRVVTHLHDPPSNSIAMGNLKIWRGVVYVCQQGTKFRFLNCKEWLIRRNDPFCQQIFKLLLVPRSLRNISIFVSQ